MKKLVVLAIGLVSMAIQAQILDPVKVQVSSKKISNGEYQIHIVANIDKGWHIYSQYSEQDEGIGPLPTAITFKQNDDVVLQGKPKEVGDLQEHFDDIFMVNVRYYYSTVDFVQTVKTKTDQPVTLEGTITYMACKEELCLTPQDVEFKVTLN
ncbi:MAG TPA: protein-disulfide reductase DsbD domain-containing protein [Flavobacteriaceae bacterium]